MRMSGAASGRCGDSVRSGSSSVAVDEDDVYCEFHIRDPEEEEDDDYVDYHLELEDEDARQLARACSESTTTTRSVESLESNLSGSSSAASLGCGGGTSSMRRRDRPHLRPNTLSIPAMSQMQHNAAEDDVPIGGSLANEHHVRGSGSESRARKGGVIITCTSRHRLQTQQSRPDLHSAANDSPVPKIKCNFVSAPSTPLGGRISGGMATSWAEGDLAHYMRRGADKMYGSIGSVDEAQEAAIATSVTLSPARYSRSFRTTRKEKARAKAEGKSKSRLSLNLNLSSPREERSPSPTPSAASARSGAGSILPRFLRNSFSRLLGGSSRKPSPAVTPGAVSPSSTCAAHLADSPPQMAGVLHESPSMAEYIEETKQSGLPIIPFANPTSVVAEKMKNRSRTTSINVATENKTGKVSAATAVPKIYPGSHFSCGPGCAATLNYDDDDDYDGDVTFCPSSIDDIVHMAETELLQERSMRGGHGAVVGRCVALQRDRSDEDGYVEMFNGNHAGTGNGSKHREDDHFEMDFSKAVA